MSTVANRLSQKQQLLDRLESDPGPNEREEIKRLLAKIETALSWLESNDPVQESGPLSLFDRRTQSFSFSHCTTCSKALGRLGGVSMRVTAPAVAFAFAVSASALSAQPVRWTTYSIPQTGTSVDFPSSIFTEEAGRPDGYGQRFRTADGRADIKI